MTPAEIIALATFGLKGANDLIALYIRIQEAAQAGDMETAQAELDKARARWPATMAAFDDALAARAAAQPPA